MCVEKASRLKGMIRVQTGFLTVVLFDDGVQLLVGAASAILRVNGRNVYEVDQGTFNDSIAPMIKKHGMPERWNAVAYRKARKVSESWRVIRLTVCRRGDTLCARVIARDPGGPRKQRPVV